MPKLDQYTFDGYWTADKGGDRVITATGVYVANVLGYTNTSSQWIRTTTPTTLFARWTQAPTYTVTYDPNWPDGVKGTGDVPTDTNNYGYDATVIVQANPGKLKAQEYVFAGWRRNSKTGPLDHPINSDGTAVAPNDFKIYGNTTLYAAWDEVGSSSNSNTVYVTRRKQGYSYWCWAAVTEMITEKAGVRKTQNAIVGYIKGPSLPDVGGTQGEIVRALRWAHATTFANAHDNPLNMNNYNTVVVQSIMANKPVQVACHPSEGGIGHSYLINGIENTNRVKMIDPDEHDRVLSLTLSSKTLIDNGFYSPKVGNYVTSSQVVSYTEFSPTNIRIDSEKNSVIRNNSTDNLAVGNTRQLYVTDTPTNTRFLKATWSSSNSSVATVSQEGFLTVAGKGTVTITATTSNGKTATRSITIP